MARLNGPLFSLDARGKLANALVYSGWKGISTARQYVVPANPQTAAQTTQRGYITSAVAAWKNYITAAEARAAWNRMALTLAGALSGFNAFVRNAIGMLGTDPDASFSNGCAAHAVQTVEFTMVNLDDGAAGDEAGNFEIWVGSTPTGMTLNEEVAIAVGVVTGTNDLGDIDDVVYTKLRKDGYDRSGISQITLIA